MEKIVALCGACGECPMVKITDTGVEIGERDNTCVLTKAQWETLKEKILRKDI
jgi:formate dehydrogenase maturation protein FdhE